MTSRLAINGFGRIGRLFLRSLIEKNYLDNRVEVVAVNDLTDAFNLAYLLKYDSVHGVMKSDVRALDESTLMIDGKEIKVLNLKVKPSELPWRDLNIDVVVESTGVFEKKEDASGHIKAGAKKVIISAPSDSDVNTYLVGVNSDKYLGEDIISNASCTTNCIAPMVYVLIREGIGLEEGLMNTMHAYTATQSLTDSPSSKDFRRGRSAGLNIVPSSTGAAKMIGEILPEVKGKLTGMSFRVPVACGSVIDLTFKPTRETSLEEINSLMKKASETYLKGVMEYTTDPIVSSDIIHNSHSCVYDSTSGIQLNSKFFKIVGWYDNEWGYSNRLVDLLGRVVTT